VHQDERDASRSPALGHKALEELANTADAMTAKAVCRGLRGDEVCVVIRPFGCLTSHNYCDN
jgi:hypothetical protein